MTAPSIFFKTKDWILVRLVRRRPHSEPEAISRGTKQQDVEAVASWKPATAGWKSSKQILGSNLTADLAKPLLDNLAYRELDEVMLVGQAQSKLEILRPLGPNDSALSSDSALAITNDTAKVSLDVKVRNWYWPSAKAQRCDRCAHVLLDCEYGSGYPSGCAEYYDHG